MFPKMNRQPTRTVSVPELSGGINLRDSVSMIADNQLTDGVNVWYKDAVLKTRPGVQLLNPPILDIIVQFTDVDQASEIVPKATEIYRTVDGETYRLYTALVKTRGEWENTILFFFVSGSKIIRLTELKRSADGTKIYNCFTIEHEDDIFCFVAEENEASETNFHLYLIEAWYRGVEHGEGGTWMEVDINKKAYTPLVATCCEMEGVESGVNDTLKNATYYEGYNLLSSRYRMQYNMDTANENHEFELLHDMGSENENITASLVGQKVIATTTNKWGGVCHHEVTLTGEDYFDEESDYGTDGLKMRVYSRYIDFSVNEGYENLVEESFGGLKNCLEIEAPFVQSPEEKAKVFKMTQQTWFGGTSAGINGGTRLFLCGNTDQQEKSLVVWSDLNNPLYFPKNNCFYVGNSSQAVTGFGKQNEMLVLFKENEIFYTYYKQGGEYSANDLISQSVIDVTSASAYFPLIQIHGSIGCDCPNTIQLCRNRLVWATSYGKVYTLATNDQYSERNVYEVSNMIERRLKAELPVNIKKAVSCDWNGMYILSMENRMYCMDYNSYGYQHIYSYLKNEDSNLRIPWWYWELPQVKPYENGLGSTPFLICSNKDNLIFSRFEETEWDTNDQVGTIRCSHVVTYIMSDKKSTDEVINMLEDVYLGTKNLPISSILQTKIFDFGVPQRNKAINLVNVSFGNNGGEPISLKYITENGEYPEEEVRLRMGDTTEYSAGYVRNKPFRPCIGLVNRFGLRFECEGDIAVDAISIDYRLAGVAK